MASDKDPAASFYRPLKGGNRGRVHRDVALCTTDGTAFSVMVGCGEQYLPAFVLALGMGQVASGLVATVPMLAGAVLQLITPFAVRRLGSCRAWVAFGAAVQALSFLPLIVAALIGAAPAWLVFACATVYWAGGLGGGAAWTTWMSMLIPARVRARYFAVRSRFCHGGVLAGLAIGALALAVTRNHGFGSEALADSGGAALGAFAFLFGIAFLCRSISSFLLTQQSESRPLPITQRLVGPKELAHRFLHGRDGRLLAYAISAGVALQFCQPFLTPYFLAGLKFGGFEFGSLLVSAFAGRIFLLGVFGSIAHTHGPLRLLWIGAAGLCPAALLPLISDHFAYLCLAQFVTGAAIAAHELGLFLMYLEAIREDERTSLLTMFNLLSALASATGSLLGGAILVHWDSAGGAPAYVPVFIGGALIRLLVLPLLWRVSRAPTNLKNPWLSPSAQIPPSISATTEGGSLAP